MPPRLTTSDLLPALSGLLFAAGIAWIISVKNPPLHPADARPGNSSSSSSNHTPTPPAAQKDRSAEDLPTPPPPSLTSTDYAQQLQTLLSLPLGPERNHSITELLARWAETDGLAALTVAGEFTEPALRSTLRETVLNHWAKTDPQAAWDHVKANPQGDLPAERFGQVLAGIGQADIGTALAFLDRHSHGELKDSIDAASAALDQLYQRGGHDQLTAWAGRLPAGPMRDMAINRIIDQWARYDPASAARWIPTMVGSNPEAIVNARRELTNSWTRVNPLQALDYVNQLPEAQRENTYYEHIFKRWLDYDQTSAAAYLAELPPGPALDRPIESYAYHVMHDNPGDTMPWVESISDPRRRWKATERVAAVWREKDPAALTAYINSATTLSKDQKAKLLNAKR